LTVNGSYVLYVGFTVLIWQSLVLAMDRIESGHQRKYFKYIQIIKHG